MSDTVSENRIYFVKALNEAINMKMEEEMADCKENDRTSLRHKIIMKQIAKGKCSEPADKVFAIKRAILVAIIAAVFALTSCTVAIVYRKKIAGFIERTFDNFVSVSADDETSTEVGKYPTRIEKVYEFTYIPEGYELKNKTAQNFVVAYIYENSNGERIKIRQEVTKESEFKVNSENGYSKEFVVDEIDIYYREEHSINTYIFKFNDYIIQFQFENKITNEELSKIVKGIK